MVIGLPAKLIKQSNMLIYANIEADKLQDGRYIKVDKGQGTNRNMNIEIMNVYKDVIANMRVEVRNDEIYLETNVESETGPQKRIYSIPLPKNIRVKGEKQKGDIKDCGCAYHTKDGECTDTPF